MKKIKLFYNPYSGNKSFKFKLDYVVKCFQEGGYEVSLFRSVHYGDIREHILNMSDDYDIIVASGGDGTINIVVNAMMERGLDIPVGIIPSGTANDFAQYLKLPKDNIEDVCKIITDCKTKRIDLGTVNGTYFINVCGGGLLSNVSQHINNDFKNAFGKLAYYIKGIEQIPNFCPIPLKITTSNEIIEGNFFVFVILNSSGAGSFENLSPTAQIDDGVFDFIAVKACPVYELAVVFLKVLKAEHTNDNRIVFFRDNYMKIECLSDNRDFSETNIDGESGPFMPIEINVIPKCLSIIGRFD